MSPIIYTYNALQARYGHIFQAIFLQERLESPGRLESPRKLNEFRKDNTSTVRSVKRDPLIEIDKNIRILPEESSRHEYYSSGIQHPQNYTSKISKPSSIDYYAQHQEFSVPTLQNEEKNVQNFSVYEDNKAVSSVVSFDSPSSALSVSRAIDFATTVAGFSAPTSNDQPTIHGSSYLPVITARTPRDTPIICETSRPPQTRYEGILTPCWQSSEGAILCQCPPPQPIFDCSPQRTEPKTLRNEGKGNSNVEVVQQNCEIAHPASLLKLKKPNASLHHESPHRRMLFLR